MTCLAGRASRLLISRVGSSWPSPATASWRRVAGYFDSLAAGSSITRTVRLLPPARATVIEVQVLAGDGLPVVGEGHHLPCLVGLREVGVGVEQGVAVGVLGEEGQHAAGA